MTMISMCQFIKQKKDICRFFFVSIFSRLDNFINITEDKRKLKLHNLDVLRSVLLSKFGRIFYGCSSLMSWKMPDDICVDIVVVWMLNCGDNFMFILFVVKLYMYVNHVDPCNNRQTIKHTHTLILNNKQRISNRARNAKSLSFTKKRRKTVIFCDSECDVTQKVFYND